MEKQIKVNLGCRTKPLPTYVNVDIDPSNQYADRTDNAFVLSTFEDNSIDFIFLDASHKYSDVRDDLNAWYTKIKKGRLSNNGKI